MTKADLAQKHQHDQAEWQTRGVAGTVTALNAANKEMTITTRGREPRPWSSMCPRPNFRRYAPDSVQFTDAKPSSFAELQAGDTVRALGDKNEDGTHLKAEELVSGAFETIAGTVDSVDAATGEVRITNLQTKKPVMVQTNQNSLLRRLDQRDGQLLARRLRPDAVPLVGRPHGRCSGWCAPCRRGGAPGANRWAWRRFRGGPAAGGGGDLQQILDRMPQLSLSELKKGDAVIVSSSKGPGDSGHRLRVCRGRGAIPGGGSAHRRTSELRIVESRCRRRAGAMIPAIANKVRKLKARKMKTLLLLLLLLLTLFLPLYAQTHRASCMARSPTNPAPWCPAPRSRFPMPPVR